MTIVSWGLKVKIIGQVKDQCKNVCYVSMYTTASYEYCLMASIVTSQLQASVERRMAWRS